LTSLHPKTYLFTNRSKSIACIMFLLKLTLFSFVLHSFLHCHIGDDLQYTHYNFWCRTWANAVLAEVLLMLFFAQNVAQIIQRAGSEMKRSDTLWSSDTPTFKLVIEAQILTIKHSVFLHRWIDCKEAFHAVLCL